VWHTVMGRSLLYHDEVTLADVLAANGYRTAMFGKWHLGDNFPMRPEDRGFHHVVNHGGGGIGQTPDYWGNTYFDDHYRVNGRWTAFEGYCTDVFFDEALAFIDLHRDQPFFVYLSTNVPHGPYRVPARYRDFYLERGVREPMASFYGMIENFDENMGRLFTHLEQAKLAENTIVLFMTDNGTAAGIAPQRQVEQGVAWRGFNAGCGARRERYTRGPSRSVLHPLARRQPGRRPRSAPVGGAYRSTSHPGRVGGTRISASPAARWRQPAAALDADPGRLAGTDAVRAHAARGNSAEMGAAARS
jgi:arylsulfatase A-like enzyme